MRVMQGCESFGFYPDNRIFPARIASSGQSSMVLGDFTSAPVCTEHARVKLEESHNPYNVHACVRVGERHEWYTSHDGILPETI